MATGHEEDWHLFPLLTAEAELLDSVTALAVRPEREMQVPKVFAQPEPVKLGLVALGLHLRV